MSRDFEAETDVKYAGLNGNCLNVETEIKISLFTENFQSCLACLLASCKPAFREFCTVQ
jgi:hypothetical protein